jgi:hypothetical protein
MLLGNKRTTYSSCISSPCNEFKWSDNVCIIIDWYIPPLPLHLNLIYILHILSLLPARGGLPASPILIDEVTYNALAYQWFFSRKKRTLCGHRHSNPQPPASCVHPLTTLPIRCLCSSGISSSLFYVALVLKWIFRILNKFKWKSCQLQSFITFWDL